MAAGTEWIAAAPAILRVPRNGQCHGSAPSSMTSHSLMVSRCCLGYMPDSSERHGSWRCHGPHVLRLARRCLVRSQRATGASLEATIPTMAASMHWDGNDSVVALAKPTLGHTALCKRYSVLKHAHIGPWAWSPALPSALCRRLYLPLLARRFRICWCYAETAAVMALLLDTAAHRCSAAHVFSTASIHHAPWSRSRDWRMASKRRAALGSD